ncbi:MAG: ABC transporter permease [Bryobacteraceae bacterium]
MRGPKEAGENLQRTLYYAYIAPDFFEALSLPLVSGQAFLGQQTGSVQVIVLSESVANELWPGKNPIGQRIVLDASNEFHGNDELIPLGLSYQVIGIAKNTRGVLPGEVDSRKAYLPLPFD